MFLTLEALDMILVSGTSALTNFYYIGKGKSYYFFSCDTQCLMLYSLTHVFGHF